MLRTTFPLQSKSRHQSGRRAQVDQVSVLYASYPGDLGVTRRQYNWTQRLRFAPPEVRVRALVSHDAPIELELPPNVTPIRATLPGKAGFLLAAIWLALTARPRGIDVFVVDRSSVALIGWACRGLGGYAWIMDVWDVPHKELTSHYPSMRDWRNRLRHAASRVKVAMMSRVAPAADLVLASVLPESLYRYRIPSSKIRAFRNAVDLELLDAIPASSDREEAICFVNRSFTPDRGLRTLIRAIELMARSGETDPRVELVGELAVEDRAAVEASPARSRFAIHGRVPLDDAYRIMATCEIGVIPFDGGTDIAYAYPIKLFEYMALGCVVVASDLPGIAAIVEQRREGLLVAPGDPRALAEALSEVLGDDGLRQRLRADAKAKVRRFEAREKARSVYAAIAEATDAASR